MSETTLNVNEKGLTITLGWIWLILLAGLVAGLLVFHFVFKRRRATPNLKLKSVTANLGFGDATFEVDHALRQTAYSIYVELTTRKIALPFDEEKDFIIEVYDSWYEAFGIIRNYLRDIAVESVDELFVAEIKKILNDGLRPHLTTWQAKFRKWYKNAETNAGNNGNAPQQLQKEYGDYPVLLDDLIRTNKLLIQFANGLRDIVFGPGEE